MINTIIIDDELKSRQILAEALKRFCPEVTLLGDATDIDDAYTKIKLLQPQLIFLDISLQEENGFQLLDRFEEISFEIVFVTAYSNYAIRAIKACALDYLLKPIDIQELRATVNKAIRKIERGDSISITQLRHNLKHKNSVHNKIAIPVRDGLEFITINDIVRLEATSNYTYLFLSGGQKLLSTRHLKEYEDILSAEMFFRSHHAHLINLNHIRKYHKEDGGYITMADGSSASIAKRKKKDFLTLFLPDNRH